MNEAEATKGIIAFYANVIDKDSNYVKFATAISNVASDSEHLSDEYERQGNVMDLMLHEFDRISFPDERNKSAWDMFREFDQDELTNWQLKTIIGVVKDHYPNVAKSCETIMREGC